MQKVTLIVSALILSVAFVGCGGSEGSASQEQINQADAARKAYEETLKKDMKQASHKKRRH